MADSFVQLNNDGPGKKIDTRTESTNGDHRQVMVIGDPTTNANIANVTAAGAVQVDGSGVTQPVSLSGNVTVIQPTGTNLHTVVDSGTVTLSGTSTISGTVTAIQPIGSNLRVVVDTAPTTAITATSLPLPSGAATSANQTNGTQVTSVNNFPVTQPISAVSLPLPSGAATSANQTLEITQLTTIANNTPAVGQATMAASSPIVIASNQSAVPVTLTSTTVTGNVTVVQPTGTNLHAILDSGTTTVTQATAANLNATITGTVTANQGTANATPWNDNIAQIAGTTTSTAAAGVIKTGITGATAATLDGVITAATAPVNGVAILTVAQTTAPSLTAGQSVAVQCDYAGSAFVKPYRRSQVVSQPTTIAASTAVTTVLAAQGAGIFADISNLMVTTTPAATTSTAYTVALSDGTKTYTFDLTQGLATAAGEDQVNINFNPPLPATTANTIWTITNSTATPTNHITIVAVLQKAS